MIQGIAARLNRDHRGFTLIELLVVIIILGILAAVVVFAVSGVGDKGKGAAYAIDRRTLDTAQQAYCSTKGVYASNQQELVDAGLLSEPSEYHDIEALDTGPCGGTGYQIVSDEGYGGVPLPSDQQIMSVGYKADPWSTNKLRFSRFGLDAGTCETLTRAANDYSVQPLLATSWALINPGNNAAYPGKPTWRFNLRSGVKFHNGTDFSASSVKYSMDRLVAKSDDFTAKLGSNSTVVVSPLVVDITPVQPNLRLPEILVHPTYGIIGDGTEPSTVPVTTSTVVCTGPFKFKGYTSGTELKVERYDDYWGPNAKLKELTFKFIGDATNRRNALESGDIDAMFDVGRQQVAGLRGNSSIQVVSAPISYVFNIYMNLNGDQPILGNPPFDKLTREPVRRALALSIDRPDFVNDNWETGVAEVANTPSPPAILGTHASLISGYTYNITQARQLLDTEGWTCGGGAPGANTPCGVGEVRQKAGEPLTLVMLSQTGNADAPLLLDLQSRILDAGIGMTITSTLTGNQRSTKKNEGTWDLDHTNPNQNDANPAFLLTLQWWSKSINRWVSCLTGVMPCGPWQQAGPTFDSLVEQALATPSADQAQLFSAQAMDLLVDQEAKVIPIAGLSRVYGLRNGVAGFEPPHPAESLVSWTNVHLTTSD